MIGRIALGIVGLAIASSAFAAPEDPRQDARMSAIWDAAHNRMGETMDVWFESGDYPRCIQLLRVMYASDRKDYETATNLGWLLESTDAYDEALAVYVQYRRENPGDPDGPFPEAHFYFKRKAYTKVTALLEPSIRMKPHSNSFRILAHSYERMGLLSDSARVWNEYLEVQPNDMAAKNNLRRVEGKIRGVGQP